LIQLYPNDHRLDCSSTTTLTIVELTLLVRDIWRRSRGWIVLALITSILVVASAIINARSQPLTGLAIGSATALNLFVALLSAGLIAIFSQISDIVKVRGLQRHFRQLFGFVDAGESVAIVLPKFDAALRTQIWDKQIKEWGIDPNLEAFKQLSLDSIGVAVQADIIAASDLIAMFSTVGFQAPTVLWDDRALEEVQSPTSPFTTFVTIGVSSNALATWVNKKTNVNRFFKLQVNPEVTRESNQLNRLWLLRIAKYHEGKIDKDEGEWPCVEFEPGKIDRGLVSKVRLPDGKCVFLVAGMHSTGTKKLGKYIAENWSVIRAWKDDASRCQILGNEFAAIVDIPLSGTQDIGNDKVVRVPTRGSRE
jgi:hypothetical protein